MFVSKFKLSFSIVTFPQIHNSSFELFYDFHFFFNFAVKFGLWKKLPRTSHEAERKGYHRVNDICKSEYLYIKLCGYLMGKPIQHIHVQNPSEPTPHISNQYMYLHISN